MLSRYIRSWGGYKLHIGSRTSHQRTTSEKRTKVPLPKCPLLGGSTVALTQSSYTSSLNANLLCLMPTENKTWCLALTESSSTLEFSAAQKMSLPLGLSLKLPFTIHILLHIAFFTVFFLELFISWDCVCCHLWCEKMFINMTRTLIITKKGFQSSPV